MNVLITGGAGFVGSHLADAWIARGASVVAVDDLSTGRYANVAHLSENHRFRLVQASATDRQTVEPLVKSADLVFHLAAMVGVRLIVSDPVKTIRTNIDATEVVLDLAASANVPLLITSTSEVYGKAGSSLLSEGNDIVLGAPDHFRWCYATSKLVDEFLALAYAMERDTQVTVVRLFNTIGPRQRGDYGMVIPRLLAQALAGEPLTVYGDGSQRRSFTWVGDAVSAMIALVQTPAAFGEIVNIGHTEDISILELAQMIVGVTGSTSPIRLVPFEEAYAPGFEDIVARRPDLTKIRGLIDYEPSIRLPDMLKWILADRPVQGHGAAVYP